MQPIVNGILVLGVVLVVAGMVIQFAAARAAKRHIHKERKEKTS